jgi:FkbM family methyltransferase
MQLLAKQKGISLACLLLCLLTFTFLGTVRRILFPVLNMVAGKEKLERTEISEKVMEIVLSRMTTKMSEKTDTSHTLTTDTRQTEAKRCERNDMMRLMKRHSRSQQGEDAYAVENFFKGLCGGIYVELGALDGVKLSNTYFFRHALEWKGALIEPNKRLFEKLKKNRAPEDDVFNAAVCASKQVVHFLDDGRNGATSGVVEFMTPAFAKKWHERTNSLATLTRIVCKSLSEILSESDVVGAGHVDFLSVDVEGGEFEVIKTLDFNKHQFGVIFYEADEHNPVKNEALKSFLANRGYPFFGHNRNSNYHVNEKWGEIYGDVLA